MPSPNYTRRDRGTRRGHTRSPSTDDAHRRPSKRRSTSPHDKRSDGRAYNVTSASRRPHRDEVADSPPPSKRRRTSDSELPERDHKHDRNRSRSPYRKERRRDERPRSRSPRRREAKSRYHGDESRDDRERSQRKRDHLNSESPPPKRKHRHDRERSQSRSRSRDAGKRSRKPLPSQDVAFKGEVKPENGEVDKPIVKEKPNFKPTGLLAQEANTVSGGKGTKIVLKYNEPPEARKPPASQKWQLFVFKGADVLDEIPIYTRSCWLLGREAAVADIHVEHPSSSKQHAVIQFRHSVKVNEFGDKTNIVRPYLIDLESANGTNLNGEKIKDSRYYEIRDKDLVKIGLSEREYVFMLPPAA